MELYTENYISLNKRLHTENDKYGANSGKWAESLLPIIQQFQINNVLDYGCGKGILKSVMKDNVKVFDNYDPAVEDYKEHPKGKYELVICTDVMEHVETKFIDNVLLDIFGLTNRLVFFNIATSKSVKQLADGRNTHISLFPENWWVRKLLAHFDVLSINKIINPSGGYTGVNFLGHLYGLRFN